MSHTSLSSTTTIPPFHHHHPRHQPQPALLTTCHINTGNVTLSTTCHVNTSHIDHIDHTTSTLAMSTMMPP